MKNITLTDFNLIKTKTEKLMVSQSLNTMSNAFYYLVLESFNNLQPDEIDDCITDTFYLQSKKRNSSHDRGIDAIHIEEKNNKTIIHFFNFKYCESFKNTKKFFPSGEISNVINFFTDLLEQNSDRFDNCNTTLKQKVNEVWNVFQTSNPILKLHLTSNHIEGLEQTELDRLLNSLKDLNVEVEEITMHTLISKFITKNKETINGKFRAVAKEYLSKSSGDLKSLICSIQARDLVRLVINNEAIRENCDFDDFEIFKSLSLHNDAFEDNVRIYLNQANKINSNIKKTALSDDKELFFFFNNGITLTCSDIDYKERVSPVVELKNIQIVNGSQTVHSLFDAMIESESFLEDVFVLLRIYETTKKPVISQIAEYTNSQTEVKKRDLRAIDSIQIKLDFEFKENGYFYERKKNQYSDETKNKRIDMEKVGQILLAYSIGMPLQAKNSKPLIFGTHYDDIFHENITYSEIMIPFELYEFIETKKQEWKSSDGDVNDTKGFIAYSSYIILYLIKELSIFNNIVLTTYNLKNEYYNKSVEILQTLVASEKNNKLDKFSNYNYLKSKSIMTHLELHLEKLKI